MHYFKVAGLMALSALFAPAVSQRNYYSHAVYAREAYPEAYDGYPDHGSLFAHDAYPEVYSGESDHYLPRRDYKEIQARSLTYVLSSLIN
jgi:hypothetical protein